MLAFIDQHDRYDDEAIAGYKAELAAHPDDSSDIIVLLSGIYLKQKRYVDTIALLQKYSDRKDESLKQLLESAQVLSGDKEAALQTVRERLEAKPNDKALQTEKARLLTNLHRNAEAVKAVKEALEDDLDANLLNSNAYFLVRCTLNCRSPKPSHGEQYKCWTSRTVRRV